MSRAYQIEVRESLRRTVRAEDHVSCQLEVLEILPKDQMADLLASELEQRGFVRDENTMRRTLGEIEVEIDLTTGTVTARAQGQREVELEGSKSGRAYDDMGANSKIIEANLRKELKSELEAGTAKHVEQLQTKLTDLLEQSLCDLRAELDQAVNRATAEALKQKAAQLGQIKQVTEDPEAGSLTIVIEV